MIHRYWTGPPPPTEPWVGNTVRSLHWPERLVDWTDDALPSRCLAWLDRGAQAVPEEDLPRHRSNMAEWWLLREVGGLWLDHDVVPLRKLTGGPPWTGYLTRGRASCAVLLPAGHDLAVAMCAEIDRRLDGPRSRCARVSGDRVLTDVCPESMGRLQLPFDASGNHIGRGDPALVHLWSTTSARLARAHETGAPMSEART